ncbi:MAG TPA: alanine--tRNA ligase [Terriglobales bacterium]|nr:alanine--tRNA ligase [Terriglobales bacterium]
MTGSETRRRFLEFFAARGHKIVPSSSLVPAHDPTLLFTNAGMNQFKDVFLGLEKRDYARAASAQKCVRAGGKHNDLDQVGFTNRHHTFFEMLGNFSFGDYFKKEAIAYAWELVTTPAGYGLDAGKLYATVFREDDDAFAIWRDQIRLPAEHIFRLDERDNFWAMGETGPCGPCSEIHYDLGPAASEAGHADCRFPCDCGRYVEIWNLVFMQYERGADGAMTPLPRPSIDTGAGLERLAAVLQGKISNFETDLFQPLIARAGEWAGVRYGQGERSDVSLRIIADHGRAVTFLIADGVIPANEGRGYVLRKILRRAIRHGKILGIEGPFLDRMPAIVAAEMRDAYPELEASAARITAVVRAEEERFARTLALALKELDKTPLILPGGGAEALAAATQATLTMREHQQAGQKPVLAGERMFKLYDTFGLPLDLLHEIAAERGFALDEAGFHEEMQAQRRRARASWKGGEKASANPIWTELRAAAGTKFEGYETTFSRDCELRALLRGGVRVEEVAAGEEAEAILDHTPFYAASGGQIGDRGIWINAEGVVAEVLDTYAPVSGLIVHRVRARQPMRVGQRVEAEVDAGRRDATRRNHTATHLLHAALRQVLGTHVKQAGSVVEPGRLRFDFTHYAPLAPDELEEIERVVNEEILKNAEVTTEILPLDRALETGAMALFGEKYQDRVRVVSVPGFSKELCGGTHTRRTGDIGLFRILEEGSIAAGVRRIEALTGEGAWRHAREAEERVRRLARLLRAGEPEVVETVERLLEQQRKLQRDLDAIKLRAAKQGASAGAGRRQVQEVAGVKIITTRADALERPQLRNLMDELRRQLGSGVVVLGSAQDGKTSLLVGVTADLTSRLSAGRIVKALPGLSGGGRPDLAEAGGKDPGALDALLDQIPSAIARLLAET